MSTQRILSIDIFRGFTIFMMVFVNDLAGVSQIPVWMKHMPSDADAMTFVDVVFPAFLFIVGMAIPYAVKNRLAKDPSLPNFWRHVLLRTGGLIVLGVFMVNSEEMNSEASLISKRWWDVLLYSAAVLIWNRYPRTEEKRRKRFFTGLRILGSLILATLYFLYRKGAGPDYSMMTHSWWGILGLIGWAYLFAMIVYMGFRQNLTAMIGVFALFIVLVLGLKSEGLVLPSFLNWLKGQSGNFAHAALTLAGISLSLILMDERTKDTPGIKIRWMLVMAVLLAIAGHFIRPFYGISKNYATPSWVFYSAAICCALFPLIYWLVDLKGIKKWAAFLKPAGENPLLTYILPPVYYALFGFSFYFDAFNTGALGFARAVGFSLLILYISGVLTKRGIRLHL